MCTLCTCSWRSPVTGKCKMCTHVSQLLCSARKRAPEREPDAGDLERVRDMFESRRNPDYEYPFEDFVDDRLERCVTRNVKRRC